MKLPPMKCTVSMIKQELIAAALEAQDVLKSAGQKTAWLVFILDAGNACFYVYGGSEPLPQPLDPGLAFCEEELAVGEFSEIAAYQEQIRAGTEIPDAPDLFELEDGQMEPVEASDAALNQRIAEIGVAAMQDLTLAPFFPSEHARLFAFPAFQAAIHTRGCRVIFADDEVACHGKRLETVIGNPAAQALITLGTPDALHYEEGSGCYTGKVELGGVPVTLRLYPGEEDDLEPALQRARELLAGFSDYSRPAEAYAVQELLPLKNEHWLEDLGDDEEPPLTPEQFTSRMTLDALVFYAEGDVTFYYDDGDMFYGHTIELMMDAGDNFIHADIPG